MKKEGPGCAETHTCLSETFAHCPVGNGGVNLVVLSEVRACLWAAVSVREGGFSQEGGRGAGWPGGDMALGNERK